jgi:hypothetical protein
MGWPPELDYCQHNNQLVGYCERCAQDRKRDAERSCSGLWRLTAKGKRLAATGDL